MTGFFDESKRAEAWAERPERQWEREVEEGKARAPQAYRYFTDSLLAEIKAAYESGQDRYWYSYGGSRIMAEVNEKFGNASIIGIERDKVHAEIERVTGYKPREAPRGWEIVFRKP